MEGQVTVDIQKNKTLQVSGEPLTGQISLRALSPFYVSRIELRVYKRFSMEYSTATGASIHPDDEERSSKVDRTVYDKTFVLYRNPLEFDEFSSGHHAFPFEVELKKADSSSVNTVLDFESGTYRVRNQYFLEANVYVKNSATMDRISSFVDVYVVNKLFEEQEHVSRIDFSYCLCFFTSNCLLHTRLDKDLYFSGDVAQLEVFVREPGSDIKIKSITVELRQHLEAAVGGLCVLDQRTISRTKGYCSFEKSSFLASIRIPATVPSNVLEKYLKLTSVIYVYVSFDMALPIKIKKRINIAKNQLEIVEHVFPDVLEGVTQDKKSFRV